MASPARITSAILSAKRSAGASFTSRPLTKVVGEIGIYRFEKGKHDKQLERLGGLEKSLPT